MSLATLSFLLDPSKMFNFVSQKSLVFTLAIIVVLALGLRLYGINWDEGSQFSLHPDERSIVWTAQQLSADSFKNPMELLDVGTSSWVPRPPNTPDGHGVYNYGSLPFYLLKSGTWALSLLPGIDGANMYTMTLIGRAFSALFDTGTVLITFLVGRNLFNSRVGILASIFTAFSVLHIQLSHFYTTEAMLTFFCITSFYFLTMLIKNGKGIHSALAGIFFGLALASKFSIAPMLFGLAIASFILVSKAKNPKSRDPLSNRQSIRLGFRNLGISLGFIILTFAATQPYAILDFYHYAVDTYNQTAMVRRMIDFPYTRQYDGSLPFLYHIWQFSVWGVGLPLAIVMWGGMCLSTVKIIVKRNPSDLLLIAWVFPFFLITGLAEVKFLRYMLPITPFLAVMGASLASQAMDSFHTFTWPRPRLLYKFTGLLIILVIFSTAFYAIAFSNVYSETHPAIKAANHLNNTAPKDAIMAQEHWEETLPGLQTQPTIILQLYDSDRTEIQYKNHLGQTIIGSKTDHIVNALLNADYIVLFSNRLYGSIPTLPDRYPISSRYYKLLFNGQLGFEVDYVSQSYPNFLGVSFVNNTFSRSGLNPPTVLESPKPTSFTLNMGHADDSFVNYEHPMTIIFKKVKQLDESILRFLIEESQTALHKADKSPANPSTVNLSRGGVMASPLIQEPEIQENGRLSTSDSEVQQEGGTFAELFNRNGIQNKIPWLIWYGTVQLIALITLPSGFWIFRTLPDKGYLLIKTTGILLVGYFTWLLASLHWLHFSRETIWLIILAIAIISLLIFMRCRFEIVSFFRTRWRFILFCEVLFFVGFMAFYGIRTWNPDLWHPTRGGEKPMDFAYFNAVVKSTQMPAYDPWFSGRSLNYYYFGQFQLASLTKLTGILPSIAFNLSIPLIFALTIGGSFSIGYNLTSSYGANVVRGPPRRNTAPFIGGITAALFVAVIGNLDAIIQISQGMWEAILGNGSFWNFDFWQSSRLIDTSSQGGANSCGGCEITEFPFFSFLFADLHAHLIALPFSILAIGIGLSLVRSSERRLLSLNKQVNIGILALTVGALFAINSWDYPTFIVLSLICLFLTLHLSLKQTSLKTIFAFAVSTCSFVAMSLLLFAPFHLQYEGSIGFPWIIRSEFTTPLHQYLGIHGIFLFITVSYLIFRLDQEYNIVQRTSIKLKNLAPIGSVPHKYPIAQLSRRYVYAILPITFVVILFAIGLHTVAFGSIIIGLVAILAFRNISCRPLHNTNETFALMLLAIALCLGIGVDIFKLNIVDPGRMNTVFKFYFHAWVLMALASAYFLWRLGFGAFIGSHTKIKISWSATLVILLISGFIYPFAATPDRSRIRFGNAPITIDGMAYMTNATFFDDMNKDGSYDDSEIIELRWDKDAIIWMQDNIKGSPVILEGNSGVYTWGNRVSIYTGLPTIVGWDWHQQQQRWEHREDVLARRSDVYKMYSTSSISDTSDLLEHYGIRYIYIGQLERLYYPEQGVNKFKEMESIGLLKKVYPNDPNSNPQVVIYSVNR